MLQKNKWNNKFFSWSYNPGLKITIITKITGKDTINPAKCNFHSCEKMCLEFQQQSLVPAGRACFTGTIIHSKIGS